MRNQFHGLKFYMHLTRGIFRNSETIVLKHRVEYCACCLGSFYPPAIAGTPPLAGRTPRAAPAGRDPRSTARYSTCLCEREGRARRHVGDGWAFELGPLYAPLGRHAFRLWPADLERMREHCAQVIEQSAL